MKRPVFSFDAEVLTDAPFEHIRSRLLSADGPAAFRCLRSLGPWLPPEAGEAGVRLRWSRRRVGAEESGALTIRPDPKGAHLCLEGRMKGWTGFVFFGLLRWKTDRLLDRLVEEL